jgi:EAL domain-containing protein (putative c-di-GMP-specific phosphodiesterase class I)
MERLREFSHYQPQIDIQSGSIVGAEALIRWNHPERGLLMPGKFIPVAEERGLIVHIGNWVMEEAARQAALWQNAGLSITVAVNVSAIQFRQNNFIEQAADSVSRHGIAPNRLELELTESVIMRDAPSTIEILDKLHDMGFQQSIDDFGTGYSSLNYLRRFPVDKIKIDQSFTKDLAHDPSAGGIVSAVIGLARNLKLQVIAEGVETKEQLEILRGQRCDQAQGFLFSRGLAAPQFEKFVRQWDPQSLNLAPRWTNVAMPQAVRES